MEQEKRITRPWRWLLLTALLVSALAAALWLWGSLSALQPSQREGGEAVPLSLSFWEEETPAAAPAGVAEPEAGPEYPYREILSEEDGILIVRIQGKRYKGVAAVIDDPTRIFIGSIPYFSEEGYGRKLDALMEQNGAVLGLNGGGFDDREGQGRGAAPIGLIILNGQIWMGGPNGSYDVCAFDKEGRLYVGRQRAGDLLDAGVQWAVSFGPAVLVDGEVQEFRTRNWEPRSAVGQRADGKIIFMALEGRQVASLGADMETLAQAMLDMGAVNATNLDGGASSSLIYKGELVNICNATFGLRGIPNGIMVRASDYVPEEETP